MTPRRAVLIAMIVAFAVFLGFAPGWPTFIVALVGLFLFLWVLYQDLELEIEDRHTQAALGLHGGGKLAFPVKRRPLVEMGLSGTTARSLLEVAMSEVLAAEPNFGREAVGINDLTETQQRMFRERSEVCVEVLAAHLFPIWLARFVDGWAEGKLCPAAADTAHAVADRAITDARQALASLRRYESNRQSPSGLFASSTGRLLFAEDVFNSLNEIAMSLPTGGDDGSR